MHQSPHVVFALADENVVDYLTDGALWDTCELTIVLLLWLRAHHDPLVLAVDGVPAVLVFLSKYEADRVDRRVYFLNPAEDDRDGSDAPVLLVSLELGLGGQAIWPLRGIDGVEGGIRGSPGSDFLAAHAPMKQKVITIIRVSCHQVDGEAVGVHFGLGLLCIVLVVDILLALRGVVFSGVIVLHVRFRLLAHLLAWVGGAILWEGLAIPIESLVPDEEMEGHSIPHVVLILLEAGVLLDMG